MKSCLLGDDRLSRSLAPAAQELQLGLAPKTPFLIVPVLGGGREAPAEAFVLAPIAQPSL